MTEDKDWIEFQKSQELQKAQEELQQKVAPMLNGTEFQKKKLHAGLKLRGEFYTNRAYYFETRFAYDFQDDYLKRRIVYVPYTIPAEERPKYGNCFDGLNVTVIPGVPFTEYFTAISRQFFDFAVIPLKSEPEFNTYKAPQRWMEYAACKIPCIVGSSEVYTTLVENGVTALVANTNEQWIEYIIAMIENSNLRLRIGANAHEFAWKHCCWNQDWTEELCYVFSMPEKVMQNL